MHCPRCGQEQVSGDLKFCSRCGLPITLISEIVSHGGTLPQLAVSSSGGIFTRNNGLKFSLLWFLVIDCLLVPLAAIAGAGEGIPILAVIGFVGAIIIAVMSVLFLSNPPKQFDVAQAPSEHALNASPGSDEAGALPAGEPESAAEFVSRPGSWKAPDTDDLVRPASVTEGTTKLLKKEKERP